MTNESIHKTWNAYQAAWADLPAEEREQLLRESVATEITFTNPLAEGQGFSNLLEHVGFFQKQFPGAFFRSTEFIVQHGQFLARWTMYNKNGSLFLPGHSYGRFNEQGLITHLAGFWQT